MEGTTTGIPAAQLRKVEPPEGEKAADKIGSKPLIGIAREVSTLDEGEAVLQWPATVSKESVQELEAWLNLVLKKLKRRVGLPPTTAEA